MKTYEHSEQFRLTDNRADSYRACPALQLHPLHLQRIFTPKKQFSWVNTDKLAAEVLQAVHLTEAGSFTLIGLYQEDGSIKTFMNISDAFTLSELQLSSQ